MLFVLSLILLINDLLLCRFVEKKGFDTITLHRVDVRAGATL